MENLTQMVSESRWLILSLPLTDETRGLVSREILSRLPEGSRVINVGRGATMDYDALAELLRNGHLAGAGIDVFPEEPLGSDSPLWNLPNTLITPHCSGNPADRSSLPAEVLLRNLHRYRAGIPLENVVDPAQGY